MRKMTNVILAGLLAVALIAGMAATTAAQSTKMGFVKEDRIVTEYKGFLQAQEQWDLESNAWNEQATTMQDELQELIDEFERQKLILSDEKKREKEASINVKREALDAFTRQTFGPGGTAERKNQSLLAEPMERIQQAIEDVAIEGNYDVIFTLQSIAYIKEAHDVTDQVLERLEETE